jgi:hypothetical protein
MRLLPIGLCATLAMLSLNMAQSGPAVAAQHCECLSINPTSADCTSWGTCKELPMSAPFSIRKARSGSDCPRSRRLQINDDGTYQLVCRVTKSKGKNKSNW